MAHSTWFAPCYEFVDRGITLYESSYPQANIVLLTRHYIEPGVTKSRPLLDRTTGRSVNVHAGEGVEYDDAHESQRDREGDDLPARPKRSRSMDGLGADLPRRRIIQSRSEVDAREAPAEKPPEEKIQPVEAKRRIVQSKPESPIEAKRLTKAESDAAEVALWKKRLREEEKREGGSRSLAVRGWRMRVLSAKSEMEIEGKNFGTQAKLSALFKRIPSSEKAWLEARSQWVSDGDPYHFQAGARGGGFAWTPWVKPECIGWLVTEGAKLGIYFATPPLEKGVPPRQCDELRLDVQNYLKGTVSCSLKVVRKPGIRGAAKVLGVGELQPLSISAMGLFEAYQAALRSNPDKREVHEAYHRVLLHRFLRRRTLVPLGSRSSIVGKESERRANMLQARRVFVFNSEGCPTRLNKQLLEENGIGIEELLLKKPTLVYVRNTQGQYLVHEWTKWLFEEVLGKKPESCRAIFSNDYLGGGLSALAGAGILG